MKNLQTLIDKINSFSNSTEFKDFIKDYFEDIQNVFKCSNYDELFALRFRISDLFYDIQNLFLRNDNQEVNAFKIILADFFERFRFAAEVQAISNLMSESPTKKRLEAALLYLRINDINEFAINFPEIIKKLVEAYEEEDYPKKLNLSLANYYYSAYNYLNVQYPYILENLLNQLRAKANSIPFLSNELQELIIRGSITESNLLGFIKDADTTNINRITKSEIVNDYEVEESEYSENFNKITNITFDEIILLNKKMMPDNLYDKLGHGVDIIEEPDLLFQYIKSYGKMHKSKLSDSINMIDFDNLKAKKIDIIDWGCGQALATFIFIEHLFQNSIELDIKSIKLIEPSSVALKRGLLHLSKWSDLIKIKPIHKDFDSLRDFDLFTNNESIKIHLFSNILDVPSFNLKNLISLIKKTQSNLNYFICISPYIDDNKNMRIQAFFNNFNENYDTVLLADRKNSKENDYWNCIKNYDRNK